MTDTFYEHGFGCDLHNDEKGKHNDEKIKHDFIVLVISLLPKISNRQS